MICYLCEHEIARGFYWAPLPRAGSYAAICLECIKNYRDEKDAKKGAKK